MLATRVLTAAILGPLVVLAAVLGEPWLSLLLGLVIVVAALETVALLDAARLAPPRALTVLGIVAVGWTTLLALNAEELGGLAADLLHATQPPGAALVVAAVATVLLGIASLAQPDPRSGFLAWASASFAVVWVGLLLPMIAVVGHLGPADGGAATPIGGLTLRAGSAWTLALILLVWGYDTGAYLTGRWLGRRKLIPHVSPSKTVEGLLGGLLLGTLAAGLGAWLTGLPAWHALLLGPIVGVAAQAGDLAESLVKRAAGRKESGSLIPGHGGILDRVDSFLFAAPVLLAYALLLAGVRA